MSKRNSFSATIGKYLGFIAASSSSSNLENEEEREISDNNNELIDCNIANNSVEEKDNRIMSQIKVNENINRIQGIDKNKIKAFDTKNFDKIDYIVQIPLVDNPNTRQTRFLLAMDYTLPARDGLGIMDTALEHIVHYYDMNKVKLIFCEMWQSVCLFIEFHDIITCTCAYNQLFQFFKTIFYVENLTQLEELWICAHCKHYNQFDEYLRGLNSINNKRKNKSGDEYVYWCKRCKNVNHPSFKKIKYSYQKVNMSKKHSSTHTHTHTHTPKHNHDYNYDAKTQSTQPSDLHEQKTIGSDHDILMGHAHGPIKFISHNKTLSISSNTSSDATISSNVSTTTSTSSIDNNLDLCCTILEAIQQETNQLNNINNTCTTQIQKQQVINKINKLNKMLNNIQHTFNTIQTIQIQSDQSVLSDTDDDILNNNNNNNNNYDNNNNINNNNVNTPNMLMGHASGPIAFKSLPPQYNKY